MGSVLRFLQTLDYMRMVVGICILIDGYPIIFFFRETLKLAPGSTAFTAIAFAGGLLLMVPFTILRRLYRPNMTMFWMGISFLLLSIFYMFTYMGDPGFKDYDRDLIYYLYVFIFLFLLINIPNDIIRVFIPVVILFTLVSNLGLIYSLITNPTWAIGQRATITLGNSDDGSGNPHVFSRNAFMGVIACGVWLVRSQTNILFRLVCLFSGALSLAVLVLTQTRSSIVALLLALAFFVYFNVRPAQIRTAVRSLIKPVPLIFMFVGLLGIIYFFRRYYDAYAILYGYVIAFMERNLENVYAILGLKANGAGYKAALDDSAANRSTSALFFSNVLEGHIHRLILGFGYKFLYLDVPILEALTNLGILGFVLFAGVNLKTLYYSVIAMRDNPNPLNTFLAYFYLLILVTSFTNGRPYEISFWLPLALMIRFMGVDHLFPAYLSNHQGKPLSDQYTVIPKAQPA
ncbi:O-antigen ligase family protein [Spirosoma fluminis]